MSKLLLWFGFLLSIPMLAFAILAPENAKLWAVALWVTIFLGAGYKLFFAKVKA